MVTNPALHIITRNRRKRNKKYPSSPISVGAGIFQIGVVYRVRNGLYTAEYLRLEIKKIMQYSIANRTEGMSVDNQAERDVCC